MPKAFRPLSRDWARAGAATPAAIATMRASFDILDIVFLLLLTKQERQALAGCHGETPSRRRCLLRASHLTDAFAAARASLCPASQSGVRVPSDRKSKRACRSKPKCCGRA